jgi:hypothetical protein
MIYNIEEIIKLASLNIYGYYDDCCSPSCLRIRAECLRIIDNASNANSYKTKYKQLTGRDISKGFEVHHIDIDRENDSIANLVLLPIKLHRRYHTIRKSILNFTNCVPRDGVICDMKLFNPEQIELDPYNHIKMFQDLYDIMNICNNWVYIRDVLLGVVDHCRMKNTDYEYLYQNDENFNYITTQL